jgi:hypothetical protein
VAFSIVVLDMRILKTDLLRSSVAGFVTERAWARDGYYAVDLFHQSVTNPYGHR